MKCKICGRYEPGNSVTCKRCISNGTKYCTQCNKVLSIENFTPRANGYRNICKDCESVNVRTKTKRIKPKKIVKENKCKTCKYNYYDQSVKVYLCQYILIEGHRRGCDANECDKYKARKRQTNASNNGWGYY